MHVFRLIWQLIQSVIFNRAMKEELSDEVCVACESEDVTRIGEGAYRCNACGYEGGSKYGEYRDGQRREALDEMSGERREERLVENLREARTLAESGLGSLKSAASMNALDMMGIGGSGYATMDGEGREGLQDLTNGINYLLEAQELCEEAAYLMGQELPDRVKVDVELGFAHAAFDSLGNIMAAEFLTASKISDAKGCGRRLRGWADERLAERETEGSADH